MKNNEFKSIEILRLQEGDNLIFTYDGIISEENRNKFLSKVEKEMNIPKSVKVIFLDNSLSLKVMKEGI